MSYGGKKKQNKKDRERERVSVCVSVREELVCTSPVLLAHLCLPVFSAALAFICVYISLYLSSWPCIAVRMKVLHTLRMRVFLSSLS